MFQDHYGPYCFKEQSEIYHSTARLEPPKRQERKFAQLYILETIQAVEQ